MGIFDKKDGLIIIAFQSYGTDTHLYLRGRALEDENINLDHKGLFQLFWNSIKRFETDEVCHTKIRLKLPDGRCFFTLTDADGYFKFNEQTAGLAQLANGEGWLTVSLSFDDDQITHDILNGNQFAGEVLIVGETANYGVVSDIDDTILHTGVVSWLKWRVIVNTFFRSASKRIPFEGAAHFYHLLHRGKSGADHNPICYVSHSPWNLYRYLDFFLRMNRFPQGPILLRSMSSFSSPISEKPHKQYEILNILDTYPHLRFILIGDSGERDADIYLEIAETYPGRILAIYLRGVKHAKKMQRIRNLINGYDRVPVLLVETSAQAIAHAQAHNFIWVRTGR